MADIHFVKNSLQVSFYFMGIQENIMNETLFSFWLISTEFHIKMFAAIDKQHPNWGKTAYFTNEMGIHVVIEIHK